MMPMPAEASYAHEPRVLLTSWAVLVAQSIFFTAIAWITLKRRT
jgi:hypothetical protein